MNRFEPRRERTRRRLTQLGVDTLLVTYAPNVSYLTGFTGEDSYLLLGRKSDVLVSDGRFTTQLADECPGLEVEIRTAGVAMAEGVKKAAAALKVHKLGFESEHLTMAQHGRMAEKLTGVELAPTTNVVEVQREIKDKEELAAIDLAIKHAEKGFAMLRAALRPEQTEKQIADELEYNLKRLGAQGVAFPPIVAAGPRAALPHARPTSAVVGGAEMLLVDGGATSLYYRSDLTRVLAIGKISPKLERVYGVVLKAQLAAIAAIKPGVAASVVDQAARRVIEEAGFGRYFTHSIGHGVGLDIHEAPRMSTNTPGPLKAGMVVTVEPGIYLPGWGGVRIEDDVLVTRGGHEVLTTAPKDIADVLVA